MIEPSRGASSAAILLLASLAACEIPKFEGPQIQSPPPAFTLNASTHQDRRMFPDREVAYHDAWVEASWGNFSGIYINGHPGVLGSGQVEAQVDGRTGWGWTEHWRMENGGLAYVAFRAAVPYDTITYAIDFLTGEPGLKARPDSLRAVVASFAVGETKPNLPLIALLASGGLLFLHVLRRRQRARVEAMRKMTLITMPREEKDGGSAQRDDSIARAIERRLQERERGPEVAT
jgi:hypothetical protein